MNNQKEITVLGAKVTLRFASEPNDDAAKAVHDLLQQIWTKHVV